MQYQFWWATFGCPAILPVTIGHLILCQSRRNTLNWQIGLSSGPKGTIDSEFSESKCFSSGGQVTEQNRTHTSTSVSEQQNGHRHTTTEANDDGACLKWQCFASSVCFTGQKVWCTMGFFQGGMANIVTPNYPQQCLLFQVRMSATVLSVHEQMMRRHHVNFVFFGKLFFGQRIPLKTGEQGHWCITRTRDSNFCFGKKLHQNQRAEDPKAVACIWLLSAAPLQWSYWCWYICSEPHMLTIRVKRHQNDVSLCFSVGNKQFHQLYILYSYLQFRSKCLHQHKNRFSQQSPNHTRHLCLHK